MKIKAKQPVKKTESAAPAFKTPGIKPVAKKVSPKNLRVAFSVRAEVGSKVFVAGSFNNWDPTAKEMIDKNNDGNYAATLSLAPGTHQYKFVIDGTWCADPECADWVQNDHGTLNSVKHVN
ncbi:MAG: glycogen-binding domain-containing protein [bacterium]